MKRKLSFVLAASVATAGVVLAEDALKERADAKNDAVLLQDKDVTMGTVRATKVMDTKLVDSAGNSVGQIKDVLFDSGRHHASYLVIGRGGIGTFGESLHAVPYRLVRFGGAGDARAHISLSEELIDKSPTWDQARWRGELADVDLYFKDHTAKLDTPVVGEEVMPAAGKLNDEKLLWTQRASKVIGRDIISPSGEKLGDINDVVLDGSTGKVKYIAMSKVAGLEERFFAIPVSSIRPQEGEEKFVLNVEAATLRTMPSFDRDHWPSAVDPVWRKDMTDKDH